VKKKNSGWARYQAEREAAIQEPGPASMSAPEAISRLTPSGARLTISSTCGS